MINNDIQNINITNFTTFMLSREGLSIAFKCTSSSKACGNDNTSLYMLHRNRVLSNYLLAHVLKFKNDLHGKDCVTSFLSLFTMLVCKGID